MCTKLERAGESTKEHLATLFDLEIERQCQSEKGDKVVYLKLSPGSEDYVRMKDVSATYGIEHTRALRILLRIGYQVYVRSIRKAALGD